MTAPAGDPPIVRDSLDPQTCAELERRIRAAGVRVEQRLELVRLLADRRGPALLAERQEELLTAVRDCALELRNEVFG